jgi:nucleotide-binding universal stress UspA family protein
MNEIHHHTSIPKKILLPVDFSASTNPTLQMAADLALHFHAELHMIHVIPFFPNTTLPDFVPEEKFHQQAMAHAEKHLDKYKTLLTARGVKATSSVEIGNDITGNIMEVIEHENIDMVVISTHGLSGWHPLVFGSIAEKLLKLVQCPVLLLHSTQHQLAVKAA